MKVRKVSERLAELGFESTPLPANWFGHIVRTTPSGKDKTQLAAIVLLSRIVGSFSGHVEANFRSNKLILDADELGEALNLEARIISENIRFLRDDIKAIETDKETMRSQGGKVSKNLLLCSLNLRVIKRITLKNRNTKKGSTVNSPKYEKTYYGGGVYDKNIKAEQSEIFSKLHPEGDFEEKNPDSTAFFRSTVEGGATKKRSTVHIPNYEKTQHGTFLESFESDKNGFFNNEEADFYEEINDGTTEKSSTEHVRIVNSDIDNKFSNKEKDIYSTNTNILHEKIEEQEPAPELKLTGTPRVKYRDRCWAEYRKFYKDRLKIPYVQKGGDRAKENIGMKHLSEKFLDIGQLYVSNPNDIEEIEDKGVECMRLLFSRWDECHENAQGKKFPKLSKDLRDYIKPSQIYRNIEPILSKLKIDYNDTNTLDNETSTSTNSEKSAADRGWKL